MEMKSPPPCPATVTVRRNPPRKARATPSSAIPLHKPLSPTPLSRNIFSNEILQNPNNTNDRITDSSTSDLSESLKVFLRIRPLTVQKHIRSTAEPKNAWPKNPRVKANSRPKMKKSSEICVHVNKDFRSVTVSTPQPLQEMKRIKSEVHEGFSHVFASEVSQIDVYEEMMKPLVEDFIKGKSGMLAAMGPSGSGKTHTVFGCAREPGMVPLALRRIFDDNESTVTYKSRVFYLSMFEIYSEKGKSERMTDLLHDGGDISMQQSVIKGLQEALVSDAQQADSLIAKGMLKRLTATTSSNSQSSRSQCIINIRRDSTQGDEVDSNASSSMLTIVDLAGAEREKKTGNQGARLLESNFINNTSMVFGQCLRSLLEHQKNRNKPPLQKHYKNSLLTRYLQDYLEGKKRMALILTVKPGVEDYLDTSFLLRQASPFTKIKFKTVDGPVNVTCNKRVNQASPQVMQPKKMKFSNSSSLIEISPDSNLSEEVAAKVTKGCLNENNEETHDAIADEIHVLSDGLVELRIQETDVKKDREYQIMQGFSKALWTVLRQYKEKLERVETECCNLRESLATEEKRNLNLVNEMTREKTRLVHLETELKVLKSRCTCCGDGDLFPVSMHVNNFKSSKYQMADLPKARNSIEDLVQCSEDTQNMKGVKDLSEVDISSKRSQALSPSTCRSPQDLIFHEDMCIVGMPSRDDMSYHVDKEQCNNVESKENSENLSCSSNELENMYPLARNSIEDLVQSSEDTQNMKGVKDPSEVDISSKLTQALSPSTCRSPQDLIYHEDMCIVDMPSRDNMSYQVEKEQCDNVESKENSENLPCYSNELKNTDPSAKYSIEDLIQSSEDTQNMKGVKDPSEVDISSKSSQASSPSTCSSPQDLIYHEDRCIVDMSSRDNTSYHVDKKQCNNVESKQNSENLPYSSNELENTDSSNELENTDSSNELENTDPSAEATNSIEDLIQSSEDTQNLKRVSDPSEPDISSKSSQVLSPSTCSSPQDLIYHEDMCIVDMPSRSQATIQSTSGSHYKSHRPEEDVVGILEYVENLEPESICVSNVSSSATSLDHEEFTKSTQHHVDKEQYNNVESKLEPLVTRLPEEGLDAKVEVKFVPKVAPSSHVQHTERPRRRLQPASSVLLKDISFLNINDENDKLKGGRVGKKGNMDDKNRTQGSLSLLNLLTRKLDR